MITSPINKTMGLFDYKCPSGILKNTNKNNSKLKAVNKL